MGEFINFLQSNLADFWTYTGFYNATYQHFIMIAVGIFFIYLAVAKEFEPMLLIPIGFGMLVGNIPLLYFLNKDWYNVLVNTGFGKGILAVCLLVLLISFAAVIRLTKPVEYKR